MKNTVRLAGGLLLVLALLLALGAMTVSAQGPTGTPTPVQAPPAVAGAGTGDSPNNAATLGSTIAGIAANSSQWFRFDYNHGNTFPRPSVTVRMINGVNSGLGFEIWSTERLVSDLANNRPVGRGTPEGIPNCTTVDKDGNNVRCTTNDLTWVGGFGAPGTYFVRVINNSNDTRTPAALIVTGSGLGACFSPAQPAQNQGGQGFSVIQCRDLTHDELTQLARSVQQAAPSVSGPAAAPTVEATATPLALPTTVITSTPAAAPTVADATATPLALPTTAAATPAPTDSAATPTAAASTPAAAPTVSGATTPATSGTTTPATTAAGLAVKQDATLGSILTDDAGRTLYVFMQDTATSSACTGNCLQNWPPLSLAGTPTAGSGVDSSKIGSLTRTEGTTQVTYNGHPLYYFAGDTAMGDTKGQGVGGNWFVISPDGNPVQGAGGATTPAASPTP